MKKSIICRKRNKFNENVSEEEMLSVEESFRINYFIYIVDQVISTIRLYVNNFKYMIIWLDFCLISKNYNR